jgi:hypothetical protein
VASVIAIESLTFIIACACGFVSRTWVRFYAVALTGIVVLLLAAGAVIATSPVGEGWSGRSDVFGHWVPSATLDAIIYATLPWIVGLTLGMFAWLASRPVTDGDRPRPAARRSGVI